MKAIITIILLDRKMKYLIAESFVYLAWARIVKEFPISRTSSLLGEMNRETSYIISNSELSISKQISSAVHAAAKYAPWETMCMVRALAAMKMLERRGIESTLYLGTSRNKENQLSAHAWLRSGKYYITGFPEMHQYTVTGRFAKRIVRK